MRKIGLAIDDPSLDEFFILKALLDEGLSPVLLYPYNEIINPDDLEGIHVVINRMVQRYRRIRFTEDLTSNGIQILNPYTVEHLCRLKPSTKRAFEKYGIRTANWFVTEHPLRLTRDKIGGNKRDIRNISETIGEQVGYPVVVKPTEGSRGLSVLQVRDEQEFYEICVSQFDEPQNKVPNALYSNTTSPEGMFVEEFLPHALDLRCLVSIKRGEAPEYLGCLARVGVEEEKIAKNTALGSIPVGVDVPQEMKDITVDCVEAGLSYISSLFGSRPEYLLVGVDILPACKSLYSRNEVYEVARKVSDYKERRIEIAKREMNRRMEQLLRSYAKDLQGIWNNERFQDALGNLDRTFDGFRSLEEYRELQGVIRRYLESSTPYATEINARVDFATNTRNLSLPRLHESIVEVALSI